MTLIDYKIQYVRTGTEEFTNLATIGAAEVSKGVLVNDIVDDCPDGYAPAKVTFGNGDFRWFHCVDSPSRKTRIPAGTRTQHVTGERLHA